MNEYRCSCGHLLFKGKLVVGSVVEIKCTNGRCRSLVTIDRQLDRELIPVVP